MYILYRKTFAFHDYFKTNSDFQNKSMYVIQNTADIVVYFQGRNPGENVGATAPVACGICPPGRNMVMVSENLGATSVNLVVPVNTSLTLK